MKRNNRIALILALAGVFAAAGLAVGYMVPPGMLRSSRNVTARADPGTGGGSFNHSSGVLEALRAARYSVGGHQPLPTRPAWPQIEQNANRKVAWQSAAGVLTNRFSLGRGGPKGAGGGGFQPPDHYPSRAGQGLLLRPTLPAVSTPGSSAPRQSGRYYLLQEVENTGNGGTEGGDYVPGGGIYLAGGGFYIGGDKEPPVTATPVPSSLWMLGSGLLALFWLSNKSRHRKRLD